MDKSDPYIADSISLKTDLNVMHILFGSQLTEA